MKKLTLSIAIIAWITIVSVGTVVVINQYQITKTTTK